MAKAYRKCPHCGKELAFYILKSAKSMIEDGK